MSLLFFYNETASTEIYTHSFPTRRSSDLGFAVVEQRTAQAAAIPLACHRNVGDMAIHLAGKIIGDQLQMQKTGRVAIIGFGDQQETAGSRFLKVFEQVAADAIGDHRPLAPRGRVNIDKP